MVVAVALVGGVAFLVDLAPRVEADFFFAPDDPQLRASRALAERYPAGETLIVRAEAPDIDAPGYVARVEALGVALDSLPGVESVFSVASENRSSPLWGRILTPPGGRATNVVAQLGQHDAEALADRVRTVLDAHRGADFALAASGVPLIVQLIRQGLARDLAVFSTVAFLAFGLVAGLVYRDPRVVAGTLLACVSASAATLLATAAAGIGVGLLTANVATIVFVLTLSHTVFLAANWTEAPQRGGARRSRAAAAVARTAAPSAWCMVTTALGFSSLLLAPARPLRELGAAGAIGTAMAFACAFTILPAWLAGARVRSSAAGRQLAAARLPAFGARGLVLLALVVGGAGAGVLRLNTDPPLLSYFDPSGPIRPGLEAIDREGGSSPLLFAVGGADGERLDNMSAYARLWELQDSLEADPATGIVLSPAPLLAHARELPLARFLPVSLLLGMLERPETGDIARGYFREDRREVLYSVRMVEADRTENRDTTIARLAAHANAAGLRVNATAGLFELQRHLGELIATSLKTGIGGLLGLFLFVGLGVARSVRGAAAMLVCLLAIPAMVLGVFGHLGVAVDIVASPAANVALAMGVDSMIHVAMRARRAHPTPPSASRRIRSQRDGGVDHDRPRTEGAHAWTDAASALAKPVAAACAIVCVGFGIFVLSDFPPTRRFGLAVVLGTATACFVALFALPTLVERRNGPGRARG